MYLSGLIIALLLSITVLLIQAIQRRKLDENNKPFISEIFTIVFASIIYSLLSWLTVAVMLIMLLNGKVWGISDDNI